MQQFSTDNEPLTPTRQHSLALTPKLNADIARIDERRLELRRCSCKLYKFLNIPRSLRGIPLANDMEAAPISQRGLSDELFEEIQFIEQAYAELLST